MKGYVKNISSEWAYVMKRSVKPGGEIPLDELFEQYGVKYNMEPDDAFVSWLISTKLNNKDKWKVIFNLDEDSSEVVKEDVVNKVTDNMVVPMVTKSMKIEDIVNLSVRRAREVLPKIMDLNLLRYSLQEATQMTDKDSLCRELRKRVRQLQVR